jgi:hypothetical protein
MDLTMPIGIPPPGGQDQVPTPPFLIINTLASLHHFLLFPLKVKKKLNGRWKKNVCLPTFFLLGARKAGTTSLFEYLSHHPKFRAPSKKEIHFFDKNFKRGLNYYQNFFPTSQECAVNLAFSGEASVGYLSSCDAPSRMKQFAKKLRIKPKFVVMLRDPV